MGQIEKTIFISYRRTNMPWALAIYQDLSAKGYDIFFDYQSINSGDFEQIILENIRARAHFLVILTPSALERCNEPGDWLRREIETAIDEKRNIVPLFLEGFDFGSPSIAKYLTGKLDLLNDYNGLNVPSDYFDEAMERLHARFLNVELDAVLHPISDEVQKVVQEQQDAAGLATNVKQKELSAQEWFEKGFKATDLDDKINCFTQAILLQPDYAMAYNNRSVALCDKGDFDGAIRDAQRSIELKNPELQLPYYNRGRARKSKGDLEGAIQDYTEAILLKPDYAMAYNNRSVALCDKGDFDGAIRDAQRSIELKNLQLHLPYYNRARARAKKGDLEGSIQDYSEALRLKPDYGEAYNNRGLARFNNGDLEGAIKDFTEAIRINPKSALPYGGRGDVWWQKQDYYAMIADYQKYLDLGGKNVEVVSKRISEAKKKIGK